MKRKITKEKLKELYYDLGMGMGSIAKKYNWEKVGEVKKLMKEYGFELRSKKESCNTKFFKRCMSENLQRKQGSEHPNWKGGSIRRNGMWYVLMPDHPKTVQGYVGVHILVAEKLLGRGLRENEIVVHLNRNKLDNRPYNLYVCQNFAEQMSIFWDEFNLPLSNIL